MKRYLLMAACVLFAAPAFAQTATPTDQFQWQMAAVNLTQASGYRFDVELDAGTPVTLAGVTCTGAASPFTCKAPIPPVTPTTHTARVRAVDANGTPIIGPFSDPITFTMRATPGQPTNLTIVPPTSGGL